MLPTFFVIGAAKAGTTSLHSYLDLHPEIHMSAIKEPSFFARPNDGRPFDQGRVDSREEYEALFESDAPVRGESSPSYSLFAWRTGVPERIHEAVPEARFVYLVREPVERAVAHYLQSFAVGTEHRDVRAAFADVDAPDHPYACASRYATQIEQYLPLFDLERFLVIDQADLLRDRRATLREIFAFLGVDPDHDSPQFDELHNVASEKRRASRAYRAVRGSGAATALQALPPRVREPALGLARRLLSRPLDKPEIDDELRARIAESLRPEAERLRALTGRPFGGWSV